VMGAADTEIILSLNTSSQPPLNWGMFRPASDSEAWGRRDVNRQFVDRRGIVVHGLCRGVCVSQCVSRGHYKRRHGYLAVHRSPGL